MSILPDDLAIKTWADAHRYLGLISEATGEWAGIPMPIPGERLILARGHPLQDAFDQFADEDVTDAEPAAGDSVWVHRNGWTTLRTGNHVDLWQNTDTGKIEAVVRRRDRYMDRLTYWMRSVGASAAWPIDAEHRALEKLGELVTEHAMRTYLLTGAFLESSTRSRVTYMFRRLRPTIALVPSDHNDDTKPMRCLAILCMHPIALYADSWAGSMVPTDDVIAHLMHMRGDEHGYWRRANQHRPDEASAGL